MSQVLVLARQAKCTWDGFQWRPTYRDVKQSIENLGTSQTNLASKGVNTFLHYNNCVNSFNEQNLFYVLLIIEHLVFFTDQ